jgi:hypothetical protein
VTVLELAVGQVLALVAFLAFPAGQYIILKALSHREGKPELWYLPDYGFRLVIRNLPRRRVLTNIRYRAFLRRRIPASEGASVATLDDHELLCREDMVLFPGTDQILVCFRGVSTDDESFSFVQTDKLGNQQQVVRLDLSARLVCDYSAVIQNFLQLQRHSGQANRDQGRVPDFVLPPSSR